MVDFINELTSNEAYSNVVGYYIVRGERIINQLYDGYFTRTILLLHGLVEELLKPMLYVFLYSKIYGLKERELIKLILIQDQERFVFMEKMNG